MPLNTGPGSEHRCFNCPPNRTVLRAHCKGKGSPPGNTRLTNVSMLVAYARSQARSGTIADLANLKHQRIYLYHGAKAPNYIPPCLHNSARFFEEFLDGSSSGSSTIAGAGAGAASRSPSQQIQEE
eukprot:COSAG05_NODE_258_length_12741_cov_168.778279_5_plen_126_part_00